MTLKEFCTILQQCANKLEEEIKCNINDVHNLAFSDKLSETKMALEKAKDYHYKEIVDSITEIFKSIKKILFHQDKIEWLSNENNFTKDELRRFSYVKRQVYAFSKPEEPVPEPSVSVKREKRRTASEISVGSLEAWEKYLDQKDKEEQQIEEKVVEFKPLVSKRTLSNARRRKKFVSSTMGEFLETDEKRRELDSIFEDVSSIEENERLSYSKSLESLDQMILTDRRKLSLSENNINVPYGRSLESLHFMASNKGNRTEAYASNKNVKEKESMKGGHENNVSVENSNKPPIVAPSDSNIMNVINDSMPKDDDRVINEIIDTIFLSDATTEPVFNTEEKDNLASSSKEETRPKIVDVIYKKKPSST